MKALRMIVLVYPCPDLRPACIKNQTGVVIDNGQFRYVKYCMTEILGSSKLPHTATSDSKAFRQRCMHGSSPTTMKPTE